MPEQQAEPQLSEAERKRIFRTLVEAQDHKTPVAQSRRLVATRFRISESQVLAIEQEGLDCTWPPLGPARKAAE
jgi:hypothetical protein